jgi:hypothetical protein
MLLLLLVILAFVLGLGSAAGVESARHALSTQLTFFFVLIFILSVGKPPWS